MLTLRNILLARDFSVCSEHALPYALDLARRVQATLHVLYADTLHESLVPEKGVHLPAGEKAREVIRHLLEGDAPTPEAFDPEELRIEHAVIRDIAPAQAILAYAQEHALDLIVMGTHGRRGVRRLLLGSVAREVVQRAPCPVLTVRKPQDREPAMPTIQRLLVPVDFSEHARAALAHAKALAGLFDAEIDLLHVVEEFMHPAFYTTGIYSSIYDSKPNIERASHDFLRKLVVDTPGPDVPIAYHVRPGRAADTIVHEAEALRSDLVVMSTHGLTGIEHFLIGSVAEQVVSTAGCPVFTLKAFGKMLVPVPELHEARPASV